MMAFQFKKRIKETGDTFLAHKTPVRRDTFYDLWGQLFKGVKMVGTL